MDDTLFVRVSERVGDFGQQLGCLVKGRRISSQPVCQRNAPAVYQQFDGMTTGAQERLSR